HSKYGWLAERMNLYVKTATSATTAISNAQYAFSKNNEIDSTMPSPNMTEYERKAISGERMRRVDVNAYKSPLSAASAASTVTPATSPRSDWNASGKKYRP